MAKRKQRDQWAVYQYGWEGADGSEYGIGDPETRGCYDLEAICDTEEEAKAICEQLEEEALDSLGNYWLPGNTQLKPLYCVRLYSPSANWPRQKQDDMNERQMHQANLAILAKASK